MFKENAQRAIFAGVFLAILAIGTSAQVCLGPDVTKVFQKGVAGSPNDKTISCQINDDGGDGTATEGQTITVGTGKRGLVAWPSYIGSATTQIPEKRMIHDANIRFTILSVSAGTSATITLTPIVATGCEPPWLDPAANVTNGVNVGPSWQWRDRRAGSGATPVAWNTPGGDGSTDTALIATANFNVTTLPMTVTLTVSAAVQSQVSGASNHGFLITGSTNTGGDVVIAADDHATGTSRPRLEVTACLNNLTGGNLVPAAPTSSTALSQGSTFFLQLAATDGDGQAITWGLRAIPVDGETLLAGNQLAYHPTPAAVGRRTIEVFGCDASASSVLGVLTLNYAADPTLVTVTVQDTGSGTLTRATSFDAGPINLVPSEQTTDETTELRIKRNAEHTLLEFPMIVGAGAGQVPAGAEIVSATLTLQSLDSPGDAIVTARRVTDPHGDGAWKEPAAQGDDQAFLGATMLFRDASSLLAWSETGGDFTSAGSSAIAMTDADDNVAVTLDVTASVAAWAAGATNQGWLLTSSGDGEIRFASDEHVTSRPILTVVYRPSGTGGNAAPVADAGGDVVVASNQGVTLDGSASYDPEGAALTYVWTQIGGPSVVNTSGNPQTFSFVAPVVGVETPITARLTVTESPGSLQDVDVITVFVQAAPAGGANAPPVADAGPDQTVAHGALVTLNGTASFDPEGNLHPALPYVWIHYGGAPPTVILGAPWTAQKTFQATPDIAPNTSDVMTFAVVVLDDIGQLDADSVRITVNRGANQSPLANAGPDQTVESGGWVGLDWRGSTDPDVIDALTYAAVQVQGPAVALRYPSTAPVNYFQAPVVATSTTIGLQVTVADPYGGQSNDTVQITVNPSPAEFTGSATSLTAYGNALTRREAQHLLRRIAFNASPATVDTVVSLGLSTSIAAALASTTPQSLYDSALTAAGIAPSCDTAFQPKADRHQVAQYLTWLTIHDQNNPLLWKLFYFWHDRMATASRDLGAAENYHFPMKHVQFLVDNAKMTAYRKFLKDLTVDELMLYWLDGNVNVVGHANENYAREFFELFALGEGNYTEDDVKAAARALTGHRYTLVTGCDTWNKTLFDSNLFDATSKTIFNQTGNWGTDDVVDLALDHSPGGAARTYVVSNLFEFFCGFSPDANQVAALTGMLPTTPGVEWDLVPVITTILKSEAMFSTTARKARVTTPADFILGFLRLTGLPIAADKLPLVEIHNNLALDLGHFLLNPPAVNGWPEGEAWVHQAAMVQRMQAISRFLEHFSLDHPLIAEADLSRFYPLAGLDDGASWAASLVRHFDLGDVSPDVFDAWVAYLDLKANPPGGPLLDYFDLQNGSQRREKGLGSLYQAALISLGQVK